MAEQLFLKWQSTESDMVIKKMTTMIQIFDKKLKNKMKNCFTIIRNLNESSNTKSCLAANPITPYITTEGQGAMSKKSKVKKPNRLK
jgi:hypothetical protein